ncbi:VOC family protein [Cohnella sp. REN36]|uniref:VOC family protein n=1 Tax=Cohnella sp. REN36 TaxID=2887347 RepID=UPI001D1520C5|nr:VOC family protein [Cohnella sp. REN36]MCC3376839.1 VOC family protein [Cohnella sp. REN36]
MTVQLIPFVFLDGNAGEAISFYEKSLDAKVVFKQTFGDAPNDPNHPLPAHAKERIAHAVLKAGEGELFVADIVPGQPHQGGNQVSICMTTDDLEKSKRFFEALQPGGQVNMPLQEVYFSPAYGVVTDKFGVTFQIFTTRQR